jgi:hypothetical protein
MPHARRHRRSCDAAARCRHSAWDRDSGPQGRLSDANTVRTNPPWPSPSIADLSPPSFCCASSSRENGAASARAWPRPFHPRCARVSFSPLTGYTRARERNVSAASLKSSERARFSASRSSSKTTRVGPFAPLIRRRHAQDVVLFCSRRKPPKRHRLGSAALGHVEDRRASVGARRFVRRRSTLADNRGASLRAAFLSSCFANPASRRDDHREPDQRGAVGTRSRAATDAPACPVRARLETLRAASRSSPGTATRRMGRHFRLARGPGR